MAMLIIVCTSAQDVQVVMPDNNESITTTHYGENDVYQGYTQVHRTDVGEMTRLTETRFSADGTVLYTAVTETPIQRVSSNANAFQGNWGYLMPSIYNTGQGYAHETNDNSYRVSEMLIESSQDQHEWIMNLMLETLQSY